MKVSPLKTEALLGIALGAGYLTSMRFMGLIGISEILFLIVILSLIKKNFLTLFKYEKNGESILKAYLLLSIVLVLPAVTAGTYFFSSKAAGILPEYVLSYIAGGLLTFLLLDAIRKNQINPQNLTIWFALVFILTNFISIFMYPLAYEDARYTGGASNPNQLSFYASALSLFLIMYQRKLFILIFPMIVFIMLKTRSDAYNLSLVMVAFIYVYLKILHSKKISQAGNIIFHTLIALIALYVLMDLYEEMILDIWMSADEGNARRSLMWNGFMASIQSPIYGWGAGAFSGLDGPFQGSEAHNTFLDLSMQFGMLFSITIYILFFSSLLLFMKRHDYLAAAFIVGFIASGLFHFSGRHFTFWVELSIFLYYIFPIKNKIIPLQTKHKIE
jgi:hypothetical protein